MVQTIEISTQIMDIRSIVDKLEKAFLEKSAGGLVIDAIGVAPAFRGLIKNS